MQILKQSTAITAKIGPFLDDTDGKTAETALTIAQADVRLSKNGGDIAQKTDATSCTHDELGIYGCPLDATDTGTLGRLQLWVHEAGALPVWHEYMVVTTNVYDTLCSTDVLQADLTQIGGVAQSATDLKDFADAGYDPATDKVQGVVLVDTTTTNTDMITTAQVNTEVDTALSDVDLDHLIQVTAGVEEPTDGSYLDQIMHKDVGQTFDDTTDSLEALRDRGDAAWITATGFSTHAAADIWTVGTRALTDKAGFSLSASGIDSIWDEVIEGTLTGRQTLRLNIGVLASKSSGGGTATLKFRDSGDAKDRVTATVDADGNRTAITLDVT